jgi:GT2 family glycosyltransferase
VSFDDDSYPVDRDFFGRVEPLFARYPRAAILAANIWQRNEPEKMRDRVVVRMPSYVGCGYAIRLAAYKEVRGTLPRPVAYGMEETDLSMQLFASGWRIYEARELRVLHDTDLNHRRSAKINAGRITNVGLFAYLHFPAGHWGRALLQIANMVRYSIRTGQFRGILLGLLQIPIECYRHRRYRSPVAWPTLKRFLLFRRASAKGETAKGGSRGRSV